MLLDDDYQKLKDLRFSEIKALFISYYKIIERDEDKNNKIYFNISFDKDKIHNLFYNRGLRYSEITQDEIYLLPIFRKDNQIYV